MHCPICFNDSMVMADHGVVTLLVNGKHRADAKFLFDVNKQTPEEILEAVSQKLDEFLKWYTTFQNRDPIRVIQLLSPDFRCENGCKLKTGTRFSVMGQLLPWDKVEKAARQLSDKYKVSIELN